MKKHLFTIAALAASMILSAQYTQTLPLDYEDFFRADAVADGGTALEKGVYANTTQSTGVIMVNQWNNGGKSSDKEGASPVIAASTLEYGAYVDNKKGSEIQLEKLSTGTRASIYSLKENYDYSGKAFYLAALINISAVSGKGDVLAFDGNYTANAQRARLFINKSGEGYIIGLGWNGDPATWSSEMTLGSTHLVVIKVIPAGNTSTGTEEAAIWIDPNLDKVEAENAPVATLAEQTIGLKSIRGITVRQRSSCAGKIAGLRFGDSWADVVKKAVLGLPALDAPAVGAASNIGAEEFTANWTAVTNASGYKVTVYAGSDEIAEKTVNDPAAVNLVFYNMPVATELTYKVVALGDLVNYDNSAASAASAAFSTMAAPASLVFLPSTDDWDTYVEEKGAYSSGSYPSTSALGYDFAKAYIERSKDEEGKSFSIIYAATDERFTARVLIDKSSNGGMMTLPAVASAALVDLYVAAGSDGKKLEVQQYNYATKAWEKLGEQLDVNKALAVHSVTPNAGAVKLRIVNADNSSKQVWKVVTFASAPATLDAPVVAEATDITSSSFTANWAAVPNAFGYRVLITSADTTIRATVASDVQTLAVDQLKPETEYTVKVAAVGDNVAYVGSILSEGKVVTTSPSSGTAIDQVNATEIKARKVVIDGQLYILKNGELFNMTGAKVQ